MKPSQRIREIAIKNNTGTNELTPVSVIIQYLDEQHEQNKRENQKRNTARSFKPTNRKASGSSA